MNLKRGWIAALLLLLTGGVALWMKWRISSGQGLPAMIDRGADQAPFWAANPQLHLVDSYPGTPLVLVRHGADGHSGLIDLSVTGFGKVSEIPCGPLPAELVREDGQNLVCLAIDKPDTGAGTVYPQALSYAVKARDTDVAKSYRDWLTARHLGLFTERNSSSAIIMEGQDEHQDSVVRISIRGSFDTSQVFAAWTAALRD